MLKIAAGNLPSIIMYSSFVLSFLKFGAPAYSVFIVNLLILFLSLIIRVFMLKPFIGLSPKHYFVDVIIRCMGVGILSSVLPISFT